MFLEQDKEHAKWIKQSSGSNNKIKKKMKMKMNIYLQMLVSQWRTQTKMKMLVSKWRVRRKKKIIKMSTNGQQVDSVKLNEN